MSSFNGIKVPPTRCAYWLDTSPCLGEAPYRVFFEDCPSCTESARPTCIGHGVCDEHAALTRNGNRRSPVDGSRLVVARIKSHGEHKAAS